MQLRDKMLAGLCGALSLFTMAWAGGYIAFIHLIGSLHRSAEAGLWAMFSVVFVLLALGWFCWFLRGFYYFSNGLFISIGTMLALFSAGWTPALVILARSAGEANSHVMMGSGWYLEVSGLLILVGWIAWFFKGFVVCYKNSWWA